MQITIQTSEPLPTGEYTARLIEIAESEGRFGTQLRWTLEIADGEHAGRRLIAFSSLNTNPQAKLVRWASALLGRALQHGETLDTEQLIGRLCRAVVVKRTDNGREFSRIEELLPLRSQQEGSS
jgi:hypothetical protein